MPIGTLFIEPEWHSCVEGKEYMSAILNRHTLMRKPFGLLEQPMYAGGVRPEVFEYKIFVCGKAAVGKTCAVAKLSANTPPHEYCETPGIQTSTVYWPAKVTAANRVVLFKLKFWDAGENVLTNYDHILPSCKEQLDAVMYVFSFTDKSSFSDIPHRMTRILAGSEHDVYQFVLGTKLDLQSENEVTQRDIADFEAQWRLRILSLGRIFTDGTRSDVEDVAPALNFICDQLWERDQRLAAG